MRVGTERPNESMTRRDEKGGIDTKNCMYRILEQREEFDTACSSEMPPYGWVGCRGCEAGAAKNILSNHLTHT